MRTLEGKPRLASVGKQAIALSIATAAAQVVVSLLYIFTAREVGPVAYGGTVTTIALGLSALGIVDFGANPYAVREMSSGRMTSLEYAARLKRKLLLGIMVAAVYAAICIPFAPALTGAAAIFLSGLVFQSILVPLRAEKRGGQIAMLLLVERIVAFATFALLVFFDASLAWGLWLSLVVGTSAASTAAWFSIATWGRPRFWRVKGSNPWTGARYYGISAVALSGQQLDLPALAFVGGSSAAGLYGAVNRWTQPMGLFASAFSSASVPFVASAKDLRSALRHVSKSAWLLLVAVLVSGLMAWAAPRIVTVLLGDAFESSATVLRLLALGTIPAILNQPMATALQARGHDRAVALTFSVSVAAQLILVGSLGHAYGAVGAGLAFCALQTILSASLVTVLLRAFRRESHVPAEGAGLL